VRGPLNADGRLLGMNAHGQIATDAALASVALALVTFSFVAHGTESAANMPGCAGREYRSPDNGELRRFDRELRHALATGDKDQIALLSSYPLQLNGLDRSTIEIASPRALLQNFAMVFPKEVVDAVLATPPEEVSCMPSGVMYANGTLWALPTAMDGTLSFRIGVVNTASTTPAPAERRGYRLTFVCETALHRTVVYHSHENGHRLRLWKKPRTILEHADIEVDASAHAQKIEGTGQCAHTIWTFEDQDAKYTLAELGCTGGDTPPDAVGELTVEAQGTSQHNWCM
jgi:hypothetical protein